MLVSRRFALIRGIATPPFRRESARVRRLALWLVLFQVVCDILATVLTLETGRSRGRPAYVRRVAWAVEPASRCVPLATCLPQALAAECLLRRVGQPAQLRMVWQKIWMVTFGARLDRERRPHRR